MTEKYDSYQNAVGEVCEWNIETRMDLWNSNKRFTINEKIIAQSKTVYN